MSSLQSFFARHPVFTSDELAHFRGSRGSHNPGTLRVLLARHRARGRLLSVRRGVYSVVPLGMEPESAPVDPYLVASRLAPDAVLGYHTALWHRRARRRWLPSPNSHKRWTDESDPVSTSSGTLKPHSLEAST